MKKGCPKEVWRRIPTKYDQKIAVSPLLAKEPHMEYEPDSSDESLAELTLTLPCTCTHGPEKERY